MTALAFVASAFPDGWSEAHIADVTLKVGSGATPRGGAAVYRDSGTSFIRSQNVHDHEFRPDGLVFLSNDAADQLAGVTVRPGDVLLNITGDSILRTCLVPPSVLPARVSQHVAIVRSNDRIVPEFLQKWLSSPSMKEYMIGHSAGGTRKAITKGHILSFPVPLPPIEEQRGIAATLGALDDKIESNRRLVELAPQLIRAKVAAAIANESDSASVSVSELATFVNGGAYTKGATGTGRMVIRIADLNSGPGASTVYNDIEVPDDKTARAGDILMSWSGSLGVYRWSRAEAIVNQHIFKVMPKADMPAWLVHDRLDAVIHVFQSVAKDKATTMGHIQRGHLESTAVLLPARHMIDHLDKELGPLWKRLLLAECEVHRLAALRDALLPELLSGRIRVPEAREVLGGAV